MTLKKHTSKDTEVIIWLLCSELQENDCDKYSSAHYNTNNNNTDLKHTDIMQKSTAKRTGRDIMEPNLQPILAFQNPSFHFKRRGIDNKVPRAQIDAANQEMLNQQQKKKKRVNLEDKRLEETLQYRLDESQRREQEAKLQWRRYMCSLAEFWQRQKRETALLNKMELGLLEKKSLQEMLFNHKMQENAETKRSKNGGGGGEAKPLTKEQLVFNQLAAMKMAQAIKRAEAEEERYMSAVTTQREAEEVRRKSEDKKRAADLQAVNKYNQQMILHKQMKQKAKLEEQKEELKAQQEAYRLHVEAEQLKETRRREQNIRLQSFNRYMAEQPMRLRRDAEQRYAASPPQAPPTGARSLWKNSVLVDHINLGP